jgi:hypothetical protein
MAGAIPVLVVSWKLNDREARKVDESARQERILLKNFYIPKLSEGKDNHRLHVLHKHKVDKSSSVSEGHDASRNVTLRGKIIDDVALTVGFYCMRSVQHALMRGVNDYANPSRQLAALRRLYLVSLHRLGIMRIVHSKLLTALLRPLAVLTHADYNASLAGVMTSRLFTSQKKNMDVRNTKRATKRMSRGFHMEDGKMVLDDNDDDEDMAEDHVQYSQLTQCVGLMHAGHIQLQQLLLVLGIVCNLAAQGGYYIHLLRDFGMFERVLLLAHRVQIPNLPDRLIGARNSPISSPSPTKSQKFKLTQAEHQRLKKHRCVVTPRFGCSLIYSLASSQTHLTTHPPNHSPPASFYSSASIHAQASSRCSGPQVHSQEIKFSAPDAASFSCGN